MKVGQRLTVLNTVGLVLVLGAYACINMRAPGDFFTWRLSEQSQQWPQYLTILSAAISAIGTGLHFGWVSPAIPKLTSPDFKFPVTLEEASYITVIGPIGYIIGSPLSALVVDKIGRKKSILSLAIPQILAWILIAVSNSVLTLYIARLISGVGEGAMFTVLPMYLAEVSEPKIRGVLGSSLTVSFILGILLINCYGSYMSIQSSAFVSLLFPVVFLLSFMFMPESPYYHIMKNRSDKAKKSLTFLRMQYDVEPELAGLTENVRQEISEPGNLKDVFTVDHNRKSFFVLLGLRTAQQFSGVSSFNLYTQLIFQQAGGQVSPSTSAIIYTTTQLIVTFLGSVLADKLGRKPLVIVSCFGTGIFLIIEGLYFYFKDLQFDVGLLSWVPITGMICYIICFSVGLGVTPNLMTGELFSAKVKAKALGLLNIYFALCIGASSKLFQALESNFGMCVPFFVYSGFCLFGMLFSYYVVPETKGKTLAEIQEEMRTGSFRKGGEEKMTRC